MSTAMQSLRPLLDRARRGWRASPLPAFLGWWGGELRGLLPLRWYGWFGSGADWHLLQHADAAWTLRRSGQGDVLASWNDDGGARAGRRAGRGAAASGPRGSAPGAAAAGGGGVAAHAGAAAGRARQPAPGRRFRGWTESRPRSPWRRCTTPCAKAAAPAAPGRLNAELVVVTRGTLDPLLARLQAQGIAVDAADVAAGDGRLGVNLLPPEQVPHRARPRRRLNLMLAAACVLLLALVLGEWLHNRQLALAQMQAEVEAMRGEAQQVAALRQQLQDDAGAAGFLARRKHDTVAMLSLLQDVTERLPDSAWLERFNVDNAGQIGLQGQSQQAVKLLDALKDSKLITGASFQGSIQPDPSSGKERFYMTARVNQPKPAAAAPAAHGDAP
ncbi:PilN domain-containing protein [Rhodanobacter sp. FW106-PBR-LB-2-11]|uniref:PilN domain-containing protein n=1 Tax=Rhodanobacter sp. FW106-PBR-LB-2-11 TaxID=1524463 RepID=UPI0034E377BC